MSTEIAKSIMNDTLVALGQHLYGAIQKYLPHTHERSMALTNLEQGLNWALKALELAVPGPVAVAAAVADDVVQAIEPVTAAPVEAQAK